MAEGRDALTGSVTKGSVLSDCQISVYSTEQRVRPGPPCTPSPLTIPTSSSVFRAGGGGGTQFALPSSRKAMSSRGGHLLVVQSPSATEEGIWCLSEAEKPRGPPCSQPLLESDTPKDGLLSALPLASLSVSAHGDATFHFFYTAYNLKCQAS